MAYDPTKFDPVTATMNYWTDGNGVNHPVPSDTAYYNPGWNKFTHPSDLRHKLRTDAYEVVRGYFEDMRGRLPGGNIDPNTVITMMTEFAVRQMEDVRREVAQRIQIIKSQHNDQLQYIAQQQAAKAKVLKARTKAVPHTGRKFREDE